MLATRILLIHDHPGVVDEFEEALAGARALVVAPDARRGLRLLEEEPFDVAVLDFDGDGDEPLEFLRRVRALPEHPEVVFLTTQRGLAAVRGALDQGAFAPLVKPFRAADAVRVVARAVEHRRLRAEVARLRRELDRLFGIEQIVGASAAMKAVVALVAHAAEGEADVCVRGEAGTGKELVARVIHQRSRRAAGAFVAVPCAGLPPGAAEERLFGTPAAPGGLVAVASGGTLFLDEVTALPAAAQERLARLLLARRGKAARREPGAPDDLRVVASLRGDLAEDARGGRLKRSLARLLRSHLIVLPPLRERREDVPLLAARFLERSARHASGPVTGFDAAALRALSAWHWPGNCRELELAVERAVGACPGPLVRLQDLPAEVLEDRREPPSALATLPYREAMDQVVARASRDYLAALLGSCSGNVSAAARRARMQRETLHRLLARYGLRSEDFRPAR